MTNFVLCKCRHCRHHVTEGEVSPRFIVKGSPTHKVMHLRYTCAACHKSGIFRVPMAIYTRDKTLRTYQDIYRRIIRDSCTAENSHQTQFEKMNYTPISLKELEEFRAVMSNYPPINIFKCLSEYQNP